MLKYEIRMDIIEKLLKPTTSNNFVKSALVLLIPVFKKGSMVKYIVSIIISIILTYPVATNKETISIMKTNAMLINEVTLAILGVVFTGYALFQAFIGKEMLLKMLKNTVVDKKEEKSLLQETNEMFANILMLCFVSITIGTLILFVLNSVPENYCLFKQKKVNDGLAGIGIFLYLYMFVIILQELKSFIGNIIQLFNLHAGTRVLEIMGEEKNDE